MANSLISNAMYLDDVPQDTWLNYIGQGYRSVVYKTDATKQGRIILFGYDKADNPKTFIMPWDSHVKYTVKYPTQEKDIYGRFVQTKKFKNVFERKKWVEAANGLTIVECLRPEQEVLHFLFDATVLTDTFNKQPLRIHYFDIETEISDQFERPADARNRINMMTIYDTQAEKFYTWSLQHADINFTEEPLKDYPKDKFVFFEFHDDEYAMLEHFLTWQEDNYADVNFGWNTKAYDLPYLVRRIENTLGKVAASRLSPVGKHFVKEVNHDNKRTDVAAEIEVNVEGLFIADGLALYRDKFGISKPDGGFTLDNIGEVEECGHKIHYEGTLKDLYLKDYQKFYEYNVRDVDLCMRIEKKTKMINLARTITTFGLSQYATIYSSISYLIGSVISFAKTEMGKTMCSYVGEKKEFKEGFEGAFVFPAQVGVFRNGTGTIDFASLYPSNIRSINASPETYRGKVLIHRIGADGQPLPVNEKDEQPFNIFDDAEVNAPDVAGFSIKYPDGKRAKVDIQKLRKWVEKKGIYTANNTIFLKHEEQWGVIAKWCEYFYNQRKVTKKRMLAIEKDLHDNGASYDEKKVSELKELAENLNSRQGAFKNMINSIYGSMGSGFSPIANQDIAQSITRQGRMCNIKASQFILKRFQEKYDTNYKGFKISVLDENHLSYKKSPKIDVSSISGDTDSSIFSAKLRIIHRKFINKRKTIQIGQLYNQLLEAGGQVVHKGDYELLPCTDIDVLTYGNKYVPIVCVSRHKTTKHMMQIFVEASGIAKDVTVTTDHVCMVYTRDHFFENTAAKDLAEGQYVAVYDETTDTELRGTIVKLEDKGPTEEYVYDLEVDDELHAFYANDILIHNSQFIDLTPVTQWMCKKYSLPSLIREWPAEKKQELWDIMTKFTDEEVNPFVRQLVHDYCKTNQQDVLKYELEYMNAMLIMEGKKHYLGHKIFHEGNAVDSLKITGISLKKNETDKAIKNFLKDCYYGVIYHDWTAADYDKYVDELYEKFKTMSIDQISFWKGWGSARESVGFLQMANGTTGIAKACIYYNQIIDKLGLGKKYDELRVGDKVRFCYIKTTNQYGINCIAYKPGMWPKEFDSIFEIDYPVMFNKLILDQLKRYREACGFPDHDPKKQVLQDIFAL